MILDNNKFNNLNFFNNNQKSKINKFDDFENYQNNINKIIKEEINEDTILKNSFNNLSRSFDNITISGPKNLLNNSPNKKEENKDLYDINNSIIIFDKPKGLVNIGATCYMNATLQ